MFGNDATEHWRCLRAALEKIGKAGITLRNERCEFGISSVRFLSKIVSGGTICVDLAKVEVIMNLDPPTNKNDQVVPWSPTLVSSVKTCQTTLGYDGQEGRVVVRRAKTGSFRA